MTFIGDINDARGLTTQISCANDFYEDEWIAEQIRSIHSGKRRCKRILVAASIGLVISTGWIAWNDDDVQLQVALKRWQWGLEAIPLKVAQSRVK